jgi:hypothetical protein
MLQRIQTIYVLLALLLSTLLAFRVPFWLSDEGAGLFLSDFLRSGELFYVGIPVLFILSAAFSFISILLYRQRLKQIICNRLNIAINFLLLGIIVYVLLSLPGENQFSEKGIGVFIPIAVIVFLALANKAILRDEKLVKSVDRLR